MVAQELQKNKRQQKHKQLHESSKKREQIHKQTGTTSQKPPTTSVVKQRNPTEVTSHLGKNRVKSVPGQRYSETVKKVNLSLSQEMKVNDSSLRITLRDTLPKPTEEKIK